MNKLRSHLYFIVLFLFVTVNSACATTQAHPPWIEQHEWENLTIKQKLEARELELQGRVNSYLAIRGYRFGYGAEGVFRDAIQRAAKDIQSLPADLQRTRVEQAVNNFRLVIDTMIIASRNIPGYQNSHYRVIGEQTFAEAMQKLCPLWPFCK